MVHDATLGAVAADAGAKVLALVVLACLGTVAVGVCDTLRLAALVRIAIVVCSAAADSKIIVHAAISVCSAAALVARVPFGGRRQSSCQRNDPLEGCRARFKA